MGKKYTVRCRELDSEGRGIVEFNNSTFSVPYLLPGEKAEISLVYGKNKTGAKLESVLTASPERTEPLCPMYRRCGGCTLMHLNYEGQLRWKQSVVERAVAGIASPKAQKKAALDPPKILPILGMEGDPLYYRNKIHSTFAKNARNDTVIGLYEEATHHVVPVKLCAIEQPVAARIRKTVLRFAREQNIPIYNEDTGRGVLRHLMFRVAKNGGVMVVIVVGQGIFREKSLLADAIVKQHPEVRTVVLNYNPKKTTMVLGNREETLYGNGYLEDVVGSCTFRLSPRSFYQVNAPQMERLYRVAVELAALRPSETAVDAYCGIGTITLLLAKSQPKAEIAGVELNPEAVADAGNNAKRNRLQNVTFTCADAGDYLKGMASLGCKLSVLVLDPPRSGCSEEFLKACLTLRPERIVYISCNPETFARDCRALESAYHLTRVQPVDMFPQTAKVELAARLELRRF